MLDLHQLTKPLRTFEVRNCRVGPVLDTVQSLREVYGPRCEDVQEGIEQQEGLRVVHRQGEESYIKDRTVESNGGLLLLYHLALLIFSDLDFILGHY